MGYLTRRSFLLAGAGAAAYGALSGARAGAAPAAAPTMVTGSFVSAARGGIPTNWAIARPPNPGSGRFDDCLSGASV